MAAGPGRRRLSNWGTDHFSIASDSDDAVVASVSDRLEATYQAVVRFCDELRLPVHPPRQPLPVLLFNRHSDFERYARTTVAFVRLAMIRIMLRRLVANPSL